MPVVHLQVAYLELLWAFIFGWMALYEEGVQKHLLRGVEPPKSGAVANLIDSAHHLLAWASGQASAYRPWPMALPSPKRYSSEIERYYGEKANMVFQKAVAFLVGHEHAHAALGHLEAVGYAKANDSAVLDMERDADMVALNGLIASGLADNEKSAESWAVVSVMLSSFYVCKDPSSALRSGKHLALHHRLAHVVDSLDLQGEGHQFYFRFLCRLVLQAVFPILLEPKYQFEDAEDALNDALDRLDEQVKDKSA